MNINSYKITDLIEMSIGTEKGSWFANPEFGSQLHTVEKVESKTASIVKSMIVAATQWLADDGLVLSLEVETERSGRDQISWRVTVAKPDGGGELLEGVWQA
ncbi:phage GP46 family protein [Candidatus Haliotispira prima]|uniref:Phage GP46 family protein n=1 Tax=Candidatus Haliotispira prima TaxID=3034016 RepID=A0ABY8MEF8_9SPIO|nr:phage GP46 family protein [Candidatus Haliotispira prima]